MERYQTLLEDWQEDMVNETSEELGISKSEVIRNLMLLGIIHIKGEMLKIDTARKRSNINFKARQIVEG